MKISIKESGTVTIVKMEGNVLGGPDAAELNNRLHTLVDSGKKKVVLDLSAVSLMNSSGLGMLIAAATTMRNSNGELKLAGASEKILTLLKVTRLISVFEHFSTVKEAMKKF